MRETRAHRSRVCVQGDTLDFIARDVIQRFTAGYVFAGELPAPGGARQYGKYKEKLTINV